MPRTPERRYQTLLDKLLGVRGVSQSKRPGFGAGLRFGGSVFAMLVDDQLVLKLPASRIESLSRDGHGGPFRLGRRVMKEWFCLSSTSNKRWLDLARESMAFVTK